MCPPWCYPKDRLRYDSHIPFTLPPSRFRHLASPSYIPGVAVSFKYIFVVETPASFRMKALLGLEAYDSDDDVEAPNCRNYYSLHWNPEVQCDVMDRDVT